jgi:hypothetical protein
MELLNPLMLWGGLAIAIPIVLHFWHQKKGKVIEWAATQWLIEKNLQQSKGIRLDSLLLLILRCLLILLFCFILSKPLINWSDTESSRRKIHLVQPNTLVINSFRFELEEALKKGEKLYWIQNVPVTIDNINQLPTIRNFNPVILQSSLNKLAHTVDEEHLELYFINNQSLAQTGNLFLPASYSLHTVIDTLQKVTKPYLSFANTKQKLFINENNQLTAGSEPDKNGRYAEIPIQSNTINVLVLNADKIEKQSINASLKALSEVYHIDMGIDTVVSATKKYDWVFNDGPLPQSLAFSASTLYILTNTNSIPQSQLNYQKNITFIPFRLSPQSSELVFNGELPEWLGELLINHYELNPESYALSNQQLNSLFKKVKQRKAPEETEFSKILLLVVIVILGTERYLAIRKNA